MLCGCTVERQVKLGAFPPPQRFGKESLWFQSIVFCWLDQRRQQQQLWAASVQDLSPPVKPAVESPSAAVAAVKPASRSRAKSRPAEKASQPMLELSEAERRHIEQLAASDV